MEVTRLEESHLTPVHLQWLDPYQPAGVWFRPLTSFDMMVASSPSANDAKTRSVEITIRGMKGNGGGSFFIVACFSLSSI